MKKNTFMRLASCLMVAVLLTTCAISGTFAKYTSSASGTDSATVAKWAINVNDTDINDSVVFDLFKTGVNYDDAAQVDVVDEKIAPGTSGSFAVKVENASDVTAKYSVTFTITEGATIPVKFYVMNEGVKTEITPSSGVYTAVPETTLAIGAAAQTQTVYWEWPFEVGDDDDEIADNDEDDTALGVAGGSLTLKATVTATQVD